MSAFPSRNLPMTLTAPTPEGRRPTCVAPRVCLGENLLPILSPANTVDLRSWKMDVSPHLAAIFFARPHIPLSQFLLPINTNPDALRIRGVVASCMAGRRQSPALQPGSVLNDSVMLSVGLRVSPGSTAELFGALPSCVGSRAGKTSKTHVESECIEPDKNIR